MRIVFLCSSLEPARDGVGDYTRLLAEECFRQGHDCAIIALHDRHTVEPIEVATTPGDPAMPTLRLPAVMPWRERTRRAVAFRAAFAPDWISLQFVPYGFNDKGIVAGLTWHLLEISGHLSRVQIMFHELWLCEELGWRGSKRMIGAIQYHFIRRLLDSIQPAVVHTSNAAYSNILANSGNCVSTLRLFGNVPPCDSVETVWIESCLQKAYCNSFTREHFWLFGIFGTIHPQWPFEPLLTQLHQAAHSAGKTPVIMSIGNIGIDGAKIWERMVQDNPGRFTFIRLGVQSATRISQYLSFIDCGIATTPISIVGKSGTVASMLEHGLPVIVNRNDVLIADLLGEDYDALLIPGDVKLVERLQAGLRRGPRVSRLPKVAIEFLSKLRQMALAKELVR
jgi:hypothetical protein